MSGTATRREERRMGTAWSSGRMHCLTNHRWWTFPDWSSLDLIGIVLQHSRRLLATDLLKTCPDKDLIGIAFQYFLGWFSSSLSRCAIASLAGKS